MTAPRIVTCPVCGGGCTLGVRGLDCICIEARDYRYEFRGPFLCTGCGGSLAWAAQVCRCGTPAGSSQRDRPMPRPTLDGAEAEAIIRRRYPVPW
jgi:hypothetical protein